MKSSKGLALIELIVVLGIIALLYGFLSLNTIRTRNLVSLETSIDILINDAKGQQIQAMTGFNQFGEVNNYYGIYFEQDRYILFSSPAYQENQSTNFPVILEKDIELISNLPDNQIIFASTSGKVENFDPNRNTVTFLNVQEGVQKNVRFNIYGVVYAID